MAWQEQFENIGKTPIYEDTLRGSVVVGYEEEVRQEKSKPERSVEEIVEEFENKTDASKLRTQNRQYNCLDDTDHLMDIDLYPESPYEMDRDKIIDWLTQTLQAERQKREEMVEAVRISEHPERLALWNEALEEGRRRERGHIQKVIDGHKVVYRTGDERFDEDAEDGDEKDHIDSCCNETMDEILQALTQPNNKFEMLAHNKSLEQYGKITYKHRPSQGNNWPDGARD